MRTILFLDVDGVIAPYGRRPAGEPTTVYPGRDVKSWVRDAVREAIVALDAQKIWLTAREEEAAEIFGPDFGFTAHLTGYDSMSGETSWWKADVLIQHLREDVAAHGPALVVWADDELEEASTFGDLQAVQAAAAQLGCEMVTMCPGDPDDGIQPEDLAWLNAHIAVGTETSGP